MDRRRNRKGIVLILSGLLLVVISCGWGWKNYLEDKRAGQEAASLMEQIAEQTGRDHQKTEEELPSLLVSGDEFCGYVVIEKIGVELPVFDDWDYNRLLEAPCRYRGSVETGDMIIVAHNYKSHFGNLKELQIGDEIVFFDAAGTKHPYVVSELAILDGTAVDDMEEGNWDFTLFTCTVGGKQRVTVRCKSAT